MSAPINNFQRPQTLSTSTSGPVVIPYAIRLPRDPTVKDRSAPVGSTWANTATQSIFGLGGIVNGEARWAPLGDHPLGDVRELEGNSGGSATPTGGKIDILGDSASGIQVVRTGASELTIFTNSSYYSGSVTTTDATPAVCLVIPVAASSTAVVEARVAAYEAVDGAGGLLSVTAHRNGAGPTVVGTLDLFKDVPVGLAGATFAVAPSGGTLEIVVTGVVGKTIKWVVQAEVTVSS